MTDKEFDALLARCAANDPTLKELKLQEERSLVSSKIPQDVSRIHRLAAALHDNTHIKSIYIEGYAEFDNQCAASLCEALETTKVQHVAIIGAKRMDDRSLRPIGILLEKTPILSLELRDSNIELDEDKWFVDNFYRALKNKSELQLLDLSGCEISVNEAHKCLESVGNNTKVIGPLIHCVDLEDVEKCAEIIRMNKVHSMHINNAPGGGITLPQCLVVLALY